MDKTDMTQKVKTNVLKLNNFFNEEKISPKELLEAIIWVIPSAVIMGTPEEEQNHVLNETLKIIRHCYSLIKKAQKE